MDETTRYDDVFAEMAGRLGGLPPMMDAFFGFLARKTDFYVVADPSSPAPMGFPEGVAKRILLQSFEKYTFQDYKDTDHYKNSEVKPTAAPKATAKPQPGKTNADTNTQPPSPAATATPEVSSGAINAPVAASEPAGAPMSPIGNGGLGPGYYWTQTLKEVSIHVDLDPGVRKGDIECTIEARRVDLKIRGAAVLCGQFEDAIRRSESMWTISSGDAAGPQVVLSLEKTRKTWWKSAVVGHPEIDTTKVDSTQSIDEYDEVTQATIRKLMFEQKEKRRLESSQGRHPAEVEPLTRDNVSAQFAPPSVGPFV